MRGSPLSRAASPDGRWAYTLYDGAGKAPFIHALDTARRTARCIDLDALTGSRYLARLRLRTDPGGSTLTVRKQQETELIVDTKTFAVSSPVAEGRASGDHRLLPGWSVAGMFGLGLLLVAGAVVFGVRRRRPRPQPVSAR